MAELAIYNEFSTLKKVIIGLGTPYQRDREQVAREMAEFPLVPDTDRKAEVLALSYPTEQQLVREYEDYIATLEKYDVEVLQADADAAYSFDYTCPRDIGFVIGDYFYIANMAVASRADEYLTIEHHLASIDPDKMLQPPAGALLEGGDVMVMDEKTVLAGYHQRSNRAGIEFLKSSLSTHGIEVIAVQHNQLHLDCCLNPLGLGHLLIHPQSLVGNTDAVWNALEQFDWIEVNATEREHLATNLLSINPGTIIARNHPACKHVNQLIRQQGYIVEEIEFDGVPATGGSFRCASLALVRE